MIAVIDNYDSFTYNLVQLLGGLGAELKVIRNDGITVEALAALGPSHIVISPGPGTPDDAGISKEIIRKLGGSIPILGVCLGHQCIGEAYGGRVKRAPKLMHGKTSTISHYGKSILAGIQRSFTATRYHSLVVETPLPEPLEAIAWAEDGELMAMAHREFPVFGLQFHPESILTECGSDIVRNFLDVRKASFLAAAAKEAGMAVGQKIPAVSMHMTEKKEFDMLKPFIAKAMQRKDLEAAEAEEAMNVIMTGLATQAQIGSYLTALRMKGETAPEIAGSAKAMRSQAAKLESMPDDLIDTCGTGGDGSHTFNISTAAAFVVAGAGKRVAKHGNRAASSKCGSADVLAALGVDIGLPPERIARCINEVGIGFLFAPTFHPAMKHAAGPRREIGQRTIFNLLGPLSNPAGATRQLLGVFDPSLTEMMARALGSLGCESAYVVHGSGGIDELVTSGQNRVSRLQDGKVETFELDASVFGLAPATKEELKGGEAGANAEILYKILSGKDLSPRRDVVLLNAGAALAVDSGDIAKGIAMARESLDSGAALAKLEALIGFGRTAA